MSAPSEHPAVERYRALREAGGSPAPRAPLDPGWLRSLCLEAGADDAGFVEIGRPELDGDRADVLQAFPGTRALISFVCRTHREPIRSPARSVANLEFHQVGDRMNEIAREVVARLEAHGIRALNPAVAFPMEMAREKIWIVSHKKVAVAAGLGRMGIHRNVIHPRFGSFVLLGTILIDAEVARTGRPIDWNPCLECKLCVAACPVGAIASDGRFDFGACYTHNYREFMGGFGDWIETIVESRTARRYRARVSRAETSSMWQSLSYGANYKAAYCIAVCPAGDDVIGPFLEDRPRFLEEVVRPLRDKVETVYVIPRSDAEDHVRRRFPHKRPRRVHSGLRPSSIRSFLALLPSLFQRGQAGDLEATIHFTFQGEEQRRATVTIRKGALTVQEGLTGPAGLRLVADSRTWLRFLAGDASLWWALLRRKVRWRGDLRLLLAFRRCFPS